MVRLSVRTCIARPSKNTIATPTETRALSIAVKRTSTAARLLIIASVLLFTRVAVKGLDIGVSAAAAQDLAGRPLDEADVRPLALLAARTYPVVADTSPTVD